MSGISVTILFQIEKLPPSLRHLLNILCWFFADPDEEIANTVRTIFERYTNKAVFPGCPNTVSGFKITANEEQISG